MAQQVVESEESRKLGNSGGILRGTRVFFIWDDVAPITAPSSILFGENGMPQLGDLFPGELEVYAVTYDFQFIPNSNGVWRVEFAYQAGSGGTPPPDRVPSEPGYLQISMDYGAVFKDFWRSSPNLNPGAGNDIGGVRIDTGGVPTSVLVAQHRLVIDETVPTWKVEDSTARARNSVGTRNSSSFFGAASGTLLYEGCSARRTTLAAFSLTHKFLYDEYGHQIQQPRLNSQRQVECISSSGFLHATWVRWVQPFPFTTNFSQLSDNF